MKSLDAICLSHLKHSNARIQNCMSLMKTSGVEGLMTKHDKLLFVIRIDTGGKQMIFMVGDLHLDCGTGY